MKKLYIGGLLLASLLIVGCNDDKADSDARAITIQDDTILLDLSSPIKDKITVDSVSARPFRPDFMTVGTVRPVSGMYAEVGVPCDGRVTEAYVRLGQRVTRGQRLFGFHSEQFSGMARDYTEASARAALAEKNLKRKKELFDSGVASARDYDEARAEADVARAELSAAEHSLRVMGINAREIRDGAFNVVSPISGEVVAQEVVNGQFMKSDAEAPIRVADLSRVWVSAKLKEYYADAVHATDSVDITLDSNQALHLSGHIYYIGQMVDERNRSVEVIVECDNRDRRLKPGMFVRSRFFGDEREAILLPAEALLQAGDHSYVLLEIRKGVFVRQQVEAESVDETTVHILSGLSAGQRVVTAGAIYLAD